MKENLKADPMIPASFMYDRRKRVDKTGIPLLPRRFVSLVECLATTIISPIIHHIYRGKTNCSHVFQNAVNPLTKQVSIPKSRLTQAMNVFKKIITAFVSLLFEKKMLW